MLSQSYAALLFATHPSITANPCFFHLLSLSLFFSLSFHSGSFLPFSLPLVHLQRLRSKKISIENPPSSNSMVQSALLLTFLTSSGLCTMCRTTPVHDVPPRVTDLESASPSPSFPWIISGGSRKLIWDQCLRGSTLYHSSSYGLLVLETSTHF